jgi:hypothetical protein
MTDVFAKTTTYKQAVALLIFSGEISTEKALKFLGYFICPEGTLVLSQKRTIHLTIGQGEFYMDDVVCQLIFIRKGQSFLEC